MGGLLSWLRRSPPPKTPITSFTARIANILKYNFRGIFGILIPFGLLCWQGEQTDFAKSVMLVWIAMFFVALFQPVAIPVVGFIAVFLLPMVGTISSDVVCKCFFGENMILFLLGGMIMLMLNNSGVDRRLIMWFLDPKSDKDLTATSLLFKCAWPAYILSGISNRLLVTSFIIQALTPPLMSLQSSTKGKDADFEKLRSVIFSAVHSSSGIGCLMLLPGSMEVITFKHAFDEDVRFRQKDILGKDPKVYEYKEIFNFLPYTIFMLPTTIVMFLVNLLYHLVLIKTTIKTDISKGSSTYIKQTIAKYKNELPEAMSSHEWDTICVFIIIYILYFFRYSGELIGAHWTDTSKPGYIQDAVIAAGAVLILHILPKSFGFLKLCAASKKSDLPPAKPESAIMYWRFVDKNTIYCYMFVIGAGSALVVACYSTGLGQRLGEGIGRDVAGDLDFALFALAATIIPSTLANMMPGCFACLLSLPFFINTARFNEKLKPYLHVIALSVGASSTLGFCFPFKYTPAYFTHHVGKVPMMQMFYLGYGSVCVSELFLWLSIAFGSTEIFGKFTEVEPAPP